MQLKKIFTFICNDFKNRVCNERGTWLGVSIGGTAAIGAGIAGMFSKKNKKEEQADPLASIRADLVNLANEGLPMERIRASIGEEFGQARKAGMVDIKEEVYAAKQAPGSIHASLVNDLVDKLSRGKSKALLDADIANRQFQMGGLQAALGADGGQQPQQEEPGFLESILPAAGEVIGGALGQRGASGGIEKLIEQFTGGQSSEEKKKKQLESGGDVITTGGAGVTGNAPRTITI